LQVDDVVMATRVRHGPLLVAMLLAAATTGCADPYPEGPVKSNIVRVNKFFNSSCWLTRGGDGTDRIDGVSFAVYLEDAERPKGVFGTGVIVVEMYRLDHDEQGQEKPVLVKRWELPREQAYPYRAKKEVGMGWGYGFRLFWDQDVDVAGKQVVMLVKYIREDGRVVASSRQPLKVPPTGRSSPARS
jgi:hypothetical protein